MNGMDRTKDENEPAVQDVRQPRSENNEVRYVTLKRLVVKHRFFEKDTGFYVSRISVDLLLLLLGLLFLVITGSSWLQLLNAAYLAFVFTQLGFIVHDSGHQQIFRDSGKNKAINILFANLLLGFSSAWWVTTHNRHHRNPNQLDLDPDIEFIALAFSAGQAMQKRGLLRFVVRNQAYFFVPLLLLEAFSLKFESLRFLVRNRVPFAFAEWSCLIAHHLLCAGVLFGVLGIRKTIFFIIVNQALLGVFLGLVFVTNHKGMPLLSKDSRIDFLERQVATARNLRNVWPIDYLFGGLSCQIEHHLFPSIPVGKLRKVQKIIKPYCESLGLHYHETGLLQCYSEVFQHLHEVGASLSRKRT
jgi:fatty acid desaturase